MNPNDIPPEQCSILSETPFPSVNVCKRTTDSHHVDGVYVRIKKIIPPQMYDLQC